MVSLEHEAPIKLIRSNPEVTAQLLHRAFGITVPEHELVVAGSEEFTRAQPAVFRGDNVVVFCSKEDEQKRLAVVIEHQLKKDARKRFSWPTYLTELHHRTQCPAILLVFCPKETVAKWARTPIDIGHPGFTLTPLVFGPDSQRLITTTAEAARSPELTILAFLTTMSRHRDRASLEVVFTALATLKNAGHKDAVLYSEMVLSLLPEPERQILETLMNRGTVEIKSDFAKHHQAVGKAEGEALGEARGEARGFTRGEAMAILKVLEARNIPVPDEVRERVISCTEKEQLDVWVTRAVTIEDVEDLFD
ncbi:hypothetical protein SMC26_37550 [Actinomadura fulvescens]|uniref:DUF4351 domain-containing protein n=1 Tax=Actinomadura fulvescens TaxID=46160 RepID=A0ABN2VU62_9ACTN